MNRYAFAALSSVLALLVAPIGCATAPDSTSEEAGSIVVDDMDQAWNLEGAVQMRVERAEGGELSLLDAPGWRKLAPGVWESPDQEGLRMVVGEEGHRWLAESVNADLDALLAQAAVLGTSDKLLEEQIVAKQRELDAASAGLASALTPTANALSCNFSLYTGPSSPVTSPPTAGAAALAKVTCSGGCLSFTITSQACCANTCTPSVAQTNLVCGTPWTAGVLRYGSGIGYASVNLNPPNISQTNSSFYCQ